MHGYNTAQVPSRAGVRPIPIAPVAMTSAHESTSPCPRATTGIAGLDDILAGGLPPRHLYLVEGSPGSGKTTLGLRFLLEGSALGQQGIYITLSETSAELRQVAQSHGWELDGIEIFDLVSDEGLSAEAEQTILNPSDMELGETTRAIMALVEQLKPERVVFDSLSELRLLAQNPLRYRRQILALKRFFHTHNCTVLMLDDKSTAAGDAHLHSIAHGVIHLEQITGTYGPDKRRLRVIKLRGVSFREGEHDFVLERGGLRVFPRLVANEHGRDYADMPLSSGNAALDDLLGGGLTPGSSLLCGPGRGRQKPRQPSAAPALAWRAAARRRSSCSMKGSRRCCRVHAPSDLGSTSTSTTAS